jgi:hypothetical protein
MWLMTNFGFFSIVQKPGDELLTVRARVKGELEALKTRYLPEMGEIAETLKSDYQCRGRVTKEAFGAALQKIALDIDYTNFKNSVSKTQGYKRSRLYGEVWQTLGTLGRMKSS